MPFKIIIIPLNVCYFKINHRPQFHVTVWLAISVHTRYDVLNIYVGYAFPTPRTYGEKSGTGRILWKNVITEDDDCTQSLECELWRDRGPQYLTCSYNGRCSYTPYCCHSNALWALARVSVAGKENISKS